MLLLFFLGRRLSLDVLLFLVYANGLFYRLRLAFREVSLVESFVLRFLHNLRGARAAPLFSKVHPRERRANRHTIVIE